MAEKIRLKIQDVVLASAMLTGSMTGVILCMATIWLGKALLPAWLETVYMLLGGILCLGLMTVYFCLYGSGKGQRKERIRKLWPVVLETELWILAVFYLRRLLDKMLVSLLQPYAEKEILRWAVSLLLILGAALIMAFFVHRLLGKCGLERAVKGFRGVLLTAGLLLLAMAGLWGADWLWSRFSGYLTPTIVSVLAARLFMACCGYGAVWFFLAVICRKKTLPEETSSEKILPEETLSEETSSEKILPEETLSEKTSAEEISPKETLPTEILPKEAISGEMTAEDELRNGASDEIISAEGAFEESVLAHEESEPGKAKESIPAGGNPVPGKTRESTSGAAALASVFGIGIPLVLWAFLFLVTSDVFHEERVEDIAAAAIEEPVNAGYAGLEKGNLTEAGGYFASAAARARALESLVLEDASGNLLSVYTEYSKDPVIAALYLSYAEAIEEMEKKIISHALGSEWYPILLKYYREQETLTEEQKLLRDEILLWYMVNQQYVRRDYLFAEEITDNRLAVQRRLKDCEEDLAVCRLFILMEQYGAAGGYTAEMAYEALELAEEYPDNILLQYIACRVAGSYQVDRAGHYGRTIEAAGRFDRLYDDGTRSGEQLIREKMFLGDVAARCYDYETALAYYEASYDLSGDSSLALSCAEIHERRGEHEQCMELAGEVLREEPDNAQALYLTVLAALKTRNLETALDAAGRLGDLVADENRAVDFREENYLYDCAQYLSMSDSGNWTNYRWKVYDSLSEEQIAQIKEHRLLWDYMTAINKCFMKKDYAAAAEAAENILAVRDDLAMGWYLRGTIAFSEAYNDSDHADYRQILSWYEKAADCGGIAPAIYFSIANVYDAMGDYENAWLYAMKVEEMLPYQDHGNDIYGISIHNRNLLRAVSAKLGR